MADAGGEQFENAGCPTPTPDGPNDTDAGHHTAAVPRNRNPSRCYGPS